MDWGLILLEGIKLYSFICVHLVSVWFYGILILVFYVWLKHEKHIQLQLGKIYSWIEV
jgi:hypothetical protein